KMLLCQSLATMALANPFLTRSVYQSPRRRPLPVVPERRTFLPEVTSKPPRILLKSYWAIHRMESKLMQDALPNQKADFLSKWKYVKR
ncbi:hypothetical protein KR059_008464, partial [Drosophila kikkawai]